QPTIRRGTARPPSAARGPFVDVDARTDPKPHRIHIVRIGLCETELALQQTGTTRGVHDPACLELALLSAAFVAHHMGHRIRPELHRTNDRAVDEANAERTCMLGKVVLENAPVELIRGRGEIPARAKLERRIDIHAAVREKETKSELLQLSSR